YCLGQMQDERAVDILISTLENKNQEPMVRHEAAEALGAIGSEKAIPYLQKYQQDPVIEVSETCLLALERIKWLKESEDTAVLPKNPYTSVDPAPPAQATDVKILRSTLINEEMSLFERYRAMFALRNIGSKEAVEALGEALRYGSALFKHEIAFVLGQMQNEHSVKYLKESLEDTDENEMVSHECA
nr:nero [Cucujiformia]